MTAAPRDSSSPPPDRRKAASFRAVFSLPVDLGRQLAMIGGTQVAQGQGSIDMRFESEGRSPAGALRR
jgi:hypothetical protein